MTDQRLIFIPLLAQVLLTALVWFWMYVTRIAEIRRSRIDVQALAIAVEGAGLLKPVAGPSDNLINLFELPVLFYVAVITLYVTHTVDTTMLCLASLFVCLRYVHSAVHITYNRVMHRFTAYASGSLVLWTLWAVIGYRLLSDIAA